MRGWNLRADRAWFVPVLGVFEVLVGVGLLLRRALRVTRRAFALQMAGTFLVLIVQPEIAFQDGNPSCSASRASS